MPTVCIYSNMDFISHLLTSTNPTTFPFESVFSFLWCPPVPVTKIYPTGRTLTCHIPCTYLTLPACQDVINAEGLGSSCECLWPVPFISKKIRLWLLCSVLLKSQFSLQTITLCILFPLTLALICFLFHVIWQMRKIPMLSTGELCIIPVSCQENPAFWS